MKVSGDESNKIFQANVKMKKNSLMYAYTEDQDSQTLKEVG